MEWMDHERSESDIFERVSKESGLTNYNVALIAGGCVGCAISRTGHVETDRNRTSPAIGSTESACANLAFRNETTI